MRRTKHGFWDETFNARVDGRPFQSAEDEFFAGEDESFEFPHIELYDAIRKLTARQAFVIRCRYGLDCQPFTVQELADLMSWHHSTVTQHLEQAETRLKELLDTRENDI